MLNLAIQSSIWQCLRSRDRETVSRDKESIGRAQAAGAVVAALCCVWVCSPRVWGPSPASHRHRLETKTEAGQRERESTEQTPELHNMCCSHQPELQTTIRQFSGNIPGASHWPLQSDLDLSWVGSLFSSPGLWTMQTPRSEEIQSSPQSGHYPVRWRHCVNKPCSVSGKTKACLWSPVRLCFVYTFQLCGAGEQHHG